ncbi:MAG: hypothetical protein HQM16_06955 [Deltaproteobacteria bacterium]|nr:hypothetical protein [Deltaproteobacteria bacterium]
MIKIHNAKKKAEARHVLKALKTFFNKDPLEMGLSLTAAELKKFSDLKRKLGSSLDSGNEHHLSKIISEIDLFVDTIGCRTKAALLKILPS